MACSPDHLLSWPRPVCCCRKLFVLKALGPLAVCVISIALMNIFDWYKTPDTKSPYIKPIGNIPKGANCCT